MTVLLLTQNLFSEDNFIISEKKLQKITSKYGQKARKRVELWNEIMQEAKSKDILHKLKDINDFWNKIKYQEDIIVWQKKDYWTTPLEFLSVGAGDSEDYAIAKYFSLRKLGIPRSKLKITSVILTNPEKRYRSRREPHLVLAYYHKPGATAIVLDNINKKLKLATKRTDLIPLYTNNNLSKKYSQQNIMARINSKKINE
ncbi:transglutaminase-like cysteine peptidase [Halarcobacter anaerophilus]|nr:transglutaminase-like cysteine peptidase [Halarcobacter anaerophilus]QDF28246.1 putative transglutaminase-like cysteine proteinase, C93 family [Halarcobacter anaerophilus]